MTTPRADLHSAVILCPEFFDDRPNGIGRVTHLISELLRQRKVATEVWSANDPASITPRPHRAFARHYPTMMGHGLARGCTAPPSLTACLHLGLSPVARLLGLRRRRTRYFVFLHGVECWQPLRARAAWGLRGASVLLANSRFTLDQFHRHNPNLGHVPALVTPLGVPDPGECPPPPPGDLQVLCVTRLTRVDAYKNIRLLITAFAGLCETLPHARLVIAGEGDDRADLMAFAAERLSPRTVSFPGRVSADELEGLWQRSHVFALPSDGEGFGLVFAEAMARGRPCLCGGRDASREVVRDGETGMVVDTGSAQAWTEALRRILTDSDVRRRLGHAGRRHFLAQFTAPAFQHRMAEACERYGLLDPDPRVEAHR